LGIGKVHLGYGVLWAQQRMFRSWQLAVIMVAGCPFSV
jgi:hypothetical protein